MESFKKYLLKESSIFSTYMTYRFASLMSKPFTKWEAYELGLIDEKGKRIKNPETRQEKDSLNSLNNMVRKIKALLVKYTRDSKFINFMISAYLLKEEKDNPDHVEFRNDVESVLSESELKTLMGYIRYYGSKVK